MLFVVFEVEGAAGAGFDAEAAFVADGFGEADILKCGHHPPDAAAGETEGAHFGHFPADPDAAAAEQAAAAVENKGFGAIVNGAFLFQRREAIKLCLLYTSRCV